MYKLWAEKDPHYGERRPLLCANLWSFFAFSNASATQYLYEAALMSPPSLDHGADLRVRRALRLFRFPLVVDRVEANVEIAPGTQVDRYDVEALIGRGGMAVVYRVRHRQLGGVHAMKVITLPSPQIQKRLLQEGKAQSGLRHPNVVAVTDVVEVGGCPALVMELIDGPGLDTLLADTHLTLEQADDIARGIIAGVAAAHRAGLIHRDLKPANVMLSMPDGRMVPKVTDFGLAKSIIGDDGASGVKTRTGVTMGTPAYMAPEQIRDSKNVDAGADIFSLGAVLYELVTGRRAFYGDDTFELFAAITGGEFVPPRDLVPDLPDHMEEAILGALKVDPAERTSSCEKLLEAWTGGESTAAVQGPWNLSTLERVASLGSAESVQPAPVASDDTWSGETFDVDVAGEPAADLDLQPPTLQPETLPPPVEAPPTKHWGRWLGALATGLLVAIPFMLGALVVVFGSITQPLSDGGVFILLIVLLGVGAIGLPGFLAVREADGYPAFFLWFVAPACVAFVGSLGTFMGLTAMAGALEQVDLEYKAVLAAAGSSIALTTDLGGLAIAAVGCTVGCLALALVFFDRTGPVQPRAKVTLAAALIGGSVLWLVHPFLSGSLDTNGQGGFFVFLILAACGASCAALASGDGDHMRRPRWIAGILTVAGVASAARAVDVRAQLELARELRAIENIVDQVLAAEGFTALVNTALPVSQYAWPLLALVVAALPCLSDRKLPVHPLAFVGPSFLALAVIGIRFPTGEKLETYVSSIVPLGLTLALQTELGVAVDDLTPETAPAWAPVGMRVTSSEGGPFEVDDVIIAVAGQPFHRSRDLLAAVRACQCGNDDGCALVDDCLKPGSSIPMTVTRKGEKRASNIDLSVSIPLGDQAAVVAPTKNDAARELAALMRERGDALIIAVAELEAVGVDSDVAAAMTLRLRGRLRNLPNTHINDEVAEGVDVAISGSVGAGLLSLERIDVGADVVTARVFREATDIDGLISELDGMLLELLADEAIHTNKSAVRVTVRKHVENLESCYEEGLSQDPDLKGRVQLSWTILASGKTIDVVIDSDTMGDDKVAACLIDGVGRLVFPAGMEGEVTWPFDFKSPE